MILKEYVEVSNALLTPLIAILALYIAWRQYRVEHHSLNNQLYERRYAVFKAFMAYLSDIMREAKTSYQRTGQFYAEASEAEFFFSGAIGSKREELYSKGLDLTALHERMYPSDGSPGLPVGEERSQVAKESAELLKWFSGQIRATRKLFEAEMKVG